MKSLTLDEIRENFIVDPEKGTIFWRPQSVVRPGRKRDYNKEIVITTPKGYRIVTITLVKGQSGQRFYVHKIIWAVVYGYWPKQLDHKNQNKADNRISNLRLATDTENARNRSKYSNNTSGYKGVAWNVYHRKWAAVIRINKKLKHLGYFDEAENAHAAYCGAASRSFGEFFNSGVPQGS